MTEGERNDDATSPAARRGKRAAYALYTVFSAAFILLSTYQLTVEVHGLRAAPLAPRAGAGEPCGASLRAMSGALDRAAAGAASAADERDAEAWFERGIQPEWAADRLAATAKACGDDPHGADALAAVMRLREARERALRRTAGELAPLRRDVAEYLAP